VVVAEGFDAFRVGDSPRCRADGVKCLVLGTAFIDLGISGVRACHAMPCHAMPAHAMPSLPALIIPFVVPLLSFFFFSLPNLTNYLRSCVLTLDSFIRFALHCIRFALLCFAAS
jgi:hypothetical protein